MLTDCFLLFSKFTKIHEKFKYKTDFFSMNNNSSLKQAFKSETILFTQNIFDLFLFYLFTIPQRKIDKCVFLFVHHNRIGFNFDKR